MAEHNQLSRGDLTAALTRAIGVTKYDTGVSRFGETLTPTIDLWGRPELLWLRNEQQFTILNSQAAVAAEFGFVAVSLPLATGLIAVIETAKASVAGFANCGIMARSVLAGTGTQAANAPCRDQRWAPNASSSPFVRSSPVETWVGTDPGGITGGIFDEVAATATTYENFTSLPYELKPGGGFVVQANTVNVAIRVVITGRVRKAYPGELEF